MASITLSQPLVGNAAQTVSSLYQVSGFVRYQNQNPVSGIRVVARKAGTGAKYLTITDADGHFIFSFENGKYGIKPIKVGLTFAPTQRRVIVSNSDVIGLDFTANWRFC